MASENLAPPTNLTSNWRIRSKNNGATHSRAAPPNAWPRQNPHYSNSVVTRLIYGHVGGLLAFWSLHNLKFNRIAFVQRSVSVSYNRCVMDKNVWSVIAPDETISF